MMKIIAIGMGNWFLRLGVSKLEQREALLLERTNYPGMLDQIKSTEKKFIVNPSEVLSGEKICTEKFR